MTGAQEKTDAAKRRRRWPLRLAAATLSLVLILAAAATSLLIALNSLAGQRWLVRALNRMLAADGIEITAISGDLYSDFRIGRLRFKDDTGIWLQIEDIAVSWAPRALLSRRIVIGELSAQRGDWTRLPAENAAEEELDRPFAWPRLPKPPLDVLLGRLALDRLAVDQEVYGVETMLRLEGGIRRMRGDRVRIDLGIETPGTAEDRVTLRLAYKDDAPSLLDLLLVVSGEPGGLLAAAARTSPGTGLLVRLEGSGPVDGWQGKLKISHGGHADFDGAISLLGRTLTLDGALSDRAALPEAVKPLVGERIGIRLAADFSVEGRIPLDIDLDFLTGRLALQHQVLLDDPEALAFAYRLHLDEAAASSLPDIAFRSLDIAGGASGAIDAPRVSASGNISGLRIAGAPTLDPDFEIAASFADGVIRIEPSRITAAAATVGFEGRLSTDLSLIDLSGHLEADRLSAVVPDLPVDGKLAFSYSIRRPQDAAAATLELEGAMSAVTSSSGSLAALIGDTMTIAATARANGSFDRFDDISLTLAANGFRLDADGGLDIGGEALALGFSLRLPDLAAVLKSDAMTLSGDVLIEGRLDGRFDALSLRAESGLEQLGIGDFAILEPSISLRIDDLPGKTDGLLLIAGDSVLGVISAAVAGRQQAAGGFLLERIDAALGPAALSGRLMIDDNGLITGRIAGGSDDLSVLPDGARARPKGKFDIRLAFAPDSGHQGLTVAASASDVMLPVGSSGMITLQGLTLEGAATLLPGRPRVDMQLGLENARSGFSHIDSIRLSADSDADGLKLTGNAIGDWRGALDLEGALTWSGGAARDDVRLEMNGSLFGLPLATGPVDFVSEDAGWRLAPFRLRLGDGALAGSARHGEGIRYELALADMPLRLFNLFLARPLPDGLVDATLLLEQASGRTHGEADIAVAIRDDGSGLFPAIPAVDLRTTARYRDGILSLDLRGNSEQDRMTLDASARMPLSADLRTGDIALERDAALEGAVHWQGEIAPVVLMLALDNNQISGDMRADIALGGTLASPDLSGRILLENGRFEHLESGFLARDLGLEASLAGNSLKLLRLEAVDGRAGKLEGEGAIRYDEAGRLDGGFSLNLDNMAAVRRNDVFATLSGKLDFAIDGRSMAATGAIRANRVDVSLDRPFRGSVVTLDVVELNQGEDPSDEDESTAARPIGLDIAIRAERRLFVRGRGLDSEWQADLKIGGDSEQPEIAGSARLIAGSFDFAGFRFTLEDGSLIFPGGREIDPLIEINAGERVGDVDVRLRLSGSLSAPALSLSSSPSLPEDEILARILFGGSTAELSPLQALQLAQTVSTLRGGGGFDVIGGARSALGLDRLDFGLGENDQGARITGGKYLSDKVYLEISSETGTGITTGTLLWSLTKRLSIRSRASSGRENSVFLRWSWDY